MNETLSEIMQRISRKWEVQWEPLQVDNGAMEILAIANMRAHLDRLLASSQLRDPIRDLPLWAKVWPSSLVLGRFLRNFSPQGKTLLELGCGMGVTSLVAASYGFGAIAATDINADALDFTRANVSKNDLAALINVRYLDVTRPAEGQWDYIAASELLYLEQLHRPLLKFLGCHLNPAGKAFFCTDLARQKPHFAKLASKKFKVTEGKIGVKTTDEAEQVERRVYSLLILEKL